MENSPLAHVLPYDLVELIYTFVNKIERQWTQIVQFTPVPNAPHHALAYPNDQTNKSVEFLWITGGEPDRVPVKAEFETTPIDDHNYKRQIRITGQGGTVLGEYLDRHEASQSITGRMFTIEATHRVKAREILFMLVAFAAQTARLSLDDTFMDIPVNGQPMSTFLDSVWPIAERTIDPPAPFIAGHAVWFTVQVRSNKRVSVKALAGAKVFDIIERLARRVPELKDIVPKSIKASKSGQLVHCDGHSIVGDFNMCQSHEHMMANLHNIGHVIFVE